MIEDTPSDSIPPEWLAAYADGELNESVRRRVERWLAQCPEALAELQDQEYLSRGNREYWNSVAPPMPAKSDWKEAFSGIANSLTSTPARTRRHILAPILSAVGLAAAVLAAVLAFDRPPHNRSMPTENPVVEIDRPGDRSDATAKDDGEDAVYRVARADDVELIEFPEAAFPLIVVGRHPMQDVPFLLASADDAKLLNYGPDDQGNLPDIQMTLGPGASMLWAPNPKP